MTFSNLIPRSFFLLLFASAPFFISCKDNGTVTESTPETIQEATLEQKKQMLQNVAPTSGDNTNAGDMAGLNPEHGQPGHRCEIPVGAPLNGSGATPIQNNGAQNQANAAPSSGMLNPAHGQPGHRCDVKVGDPL